MTGAALCIPPPGSKAHCPQLSPTPASSPQVSCGRTSGEDQHVAATPRILLRMTATRPRGCLVGPNPSWTPLLFVLWEEVALAAQIN